MKDYVKTFLWGSLGLFLGIYIVIKGRFSLMGYPLIVLSLLMFVLGFSQLFRKEKSRKKSKK